MFFILLILPNPIRQEVWVFCLLLLLLLLLFVFYQARVELFFFYPKSASAFVSACFYTNSLANI